MYGNNKIYKYKYYCIRLQITIDSIQTVIIIIFIIYINKRKNTNFTRYLRYIQLTLNIYSYLYNNDIIKEERKKEQYMQIQLCTKAHTHPSKIILYTCNT